MNPEEAAAKLRQMLDANAEAFRRQPRVHYIVTDVYPRNNHQRLVRIFIVMPNGDVEDLEYFLMRATQTPRGTRNTIRDGQYTREAGFRMDGIGGQDTMADVRDLFIEALDVGGDDAREYVRNIEFIAVVP